LPNNRTKKDTDNIAIFLKLIAYIMARLNK
jgi:hypothetical protein